MINEARPLSLYKKAVGKKIEKWDQFTGKKYKDQNRQSWNFWAINKQLLPNWWKTEILNQKYSYN